MVSTAILLDKDTVSMDNMVALHRVSANKDRINWLSKVKPSVPLKRLLEALGRAFLDLVIGPRKLSDRPRKR
jgi:molybdopterin-guanine dinucleotide biosynthesis protein